MHSLEEGRRHFALLSYQLEEGELIGFERNHRTLLSPVQISGEPLAGEQRKYLGSPNWAQMYAFV